MPLLETADAMGPNATAANDSADKLYFTLVRVWRNILFPPDIPSPLDDFPISQVRCLNIIDNNEGRKMQEIAALLNIKLPAMSQMVDRLVRKDLLERRPDPTDRRVARLHLTPEARQMIQEARQIRMNYLRRVASALEGADITRITEDLELLATLAEKGRQQGSATRRENLDTNRSVGTVETRDPLVDLLADRARNSKS